MDLYTLSKGHLDAWCDTEYKYEGRQKWKHFNLRIGRLTLTITWRCYLKRYEYNADEEVLEEVTYG